MIVKPSIMVEDFRKSAGGVTASKNKSRLYVKNRITPRNPRTESQTQVRSDLTTNSRAWSQLTQAQRDAWNEYAKSVLGRRQLGAAAKISGFNAYMRIANNLAVINLPALTMPPSSVEFPVYEISNVVYVAPVGETPGTLTISFAGLTTLTGMHMIVKATAPFSGGRASLPSALRVITNNASVATGSTEVLASYNAKFGAFASAGQKVEIQVYLIDDATGLASLKQSFVYLQSA